MSEHIEEMLADCSRMIDKLPSESEFCKLERQCAELQEALALACAFLWPLEPGDSRAVSDEFVALAAASTGDTRPEVMAVIRQALSRVRTPPERNSQAASEERGK